MRHDISQTKPIALIAGIVLLVMVAGILLAWPAAHKEATEAPYGADVIARASYRCEGGKSILATFRKERVTLELSDLRILTVPEAPAASGVRYANANDRFVFWTKGKTAFVQEGGGITFARCVEE